MTDMTSITPITISRPRLLCLRFGSLGTVTMVMAIAAAHARAVEMAHVAPFSASRPTATFAPEENLEGRDPRW